MAASNPEENQSAEEPHCPICLGKFKTPRQLTCLHSFCQGCLEDYISSKTGNVTELKQFECPICRTVILIPRKCEKSVIGASLFPINTLLQSIGGKEKEEVDRPCDCCLSDGVSTTANGFCVVCEEAMCASCIKSHQKQKATKDHSIITIEELTNNPNNSIRFDKCFRCQEHEDEELKFYCKDHKITCCASCCIVHHRSCYHVLDLRKDVNNLLKDVKPLQLLEEMKKIEKHLMNIEKKNNSNIVMLESQVEEMTNKIKEIRKKMNDLLDNLERKVKLEGNQMYKQESIRKQEKNHECQALLNAVQNSHVTLETVMKHGSDMQIFIMADRMILQVKLYYEQIKEKLDETETVTLYLEIDPQFQYLLSMSSDIGRVICRKESERFPLSRKDKPLKECQVEMMETVEIRDPNNVKVCYTGVTYLQRDQVMLTDFCNNRVVVLDSSYQCTARLTLPDIPWDICVVDDDEVVVSLPFQNTLQFLSVTNGIMKCTRTVQSRYECWGIASLGRGNIIVSGICGYNGTLYWSLINKTGLEEKCHQIHCKCSSSPTCVALNSACTRVHITVYRENSLYCFDMDGTMMYQYSPDSLKGLRGVATDRNDNVYVVGNESRNIHQLTPEGTPIRIITDGVPKSPLAICFNNRRDKFLITNDSIGSERKVLCIFRFNEYLRFSSSIVG